MSAASDPADRAAYIDSEDSMKSFLGDEDDVSFEFDPTVGNQGAFVLTDEVNASEIIRTELGATPEVFISGNLTVSGQSTTVDNIITTDVFVQGIDGNDQIHISGDTTTKYIQLLSGGELRTGGGGAEGVSIRDVSNDRLLAEFGEGGPIVFNDPEADVDTRVATTASANSLAVRGSDGHIGLGNAPTSSVQLDLDPPAEQIDANSSFYRSEVGNTGQLTVQDGTTSPEIAAYHVKEPGISLAGTGSVTDAATVIIENRPAEGNSNYSILAREGNIVFNETQQEDDFRVASADSTDMLHVHGQAGASGNQVSVHAGLNQDWGSLFVQPRQASGAAEVDLVATLGDSNGSAAIDANNSEVWGTRIGNPEVTASNQTTITDSSPLFVAGPIQPGTNVTITNRYLSYMLDSAGNETWYIENGGRVEAAKGPVAIASDDSELFLGAGDDVAVRFDPQAGTNGAMVFSDEVNGTRFMQMNVGSNIEIEAKTLEIRNANDADFFALTDGTTGDIFRMRGFGDEEFGFQIRDSSAAVNRETVRFDPATGETKIQNGASVVSGDFALTTDGAQVLWGAGPDFGVRYDATDDELVVNDEVNGDDVASVDKTGNMQLQGTLTESTTV